MVVVVVVVSAIVVIAASILLIGCALGYITVNQEIALGYSVRRLPLMSLFLKGIRVFGRADVEQLPS